MKTSVQSLIAGLAVLLAQLSLATPDPVGLDGLLTGSLRYEPVSIRNVKLTDAFWLPIIQTVQTRTIAYAIDKCEQEGRMENFLVAGGKMQGTTRGAMPFDDTDLYKIIEGASSSLISAPNPQLEKQLDGIIEIIAAGQEKDGYLTTWRTIDGMHPPAHWVKPGQRWHDLGASHELYNAGHLFEAAAQHYAAVGKTNLLNIAIAYADLLVETFGPGKLETVPGHQIVETGLIKLYRITGNEAYLRLARYFLDFRGRTGGGKRELYGAYNQDHLPVIEQRECVGHAVRAVYMYAGMTDIAEIFKDEAYWNAVQALWQNMVQKKLYITGGIGARHEGEAFGDNYELPNLTAYAETCASIGSVIWNHRLYQITGNKEYYDIIERTLYNGTISGISLDGTRFLYPNCLESDKQFAFNKGYHTRAEWFDCSCCPTNLIRFIPTIPELVYATRDRTIAINLYVSNVADIELDGEPVRITQNTGYPWDGKVQVIVDTASEKPVTLKLRVPGWMENTPAPGGLYHYMDSATNTLQVSLNGIPIEYHSQDGYILIDRKWEPGDAIEWEFPMPVRKVVASQQVNELKGLAALERGPLVYCFEEPDNGIPVTGIHLQRKSSFETAPDVPPGKVVSLKSLGRQDQQVTAIPYFAWANRGVSSMRVWVPLQD